MNTASMIRFLEADADALQRQLDAHSPRLTPEGRAWLARTIQAELWVVRRLRMAEKKMPGPS